MSVPPIGADDGSPPTTPESPLTLQGHWLTPDRGLPLVVVGPSLGTGVVPLWQECAQQLGGELDVLGWELPGHGEGPPRDQPFTVADLAAAVVALVDEHRPGADFVHAGVSVAGVVGLDLAVGRTLRERSLEPTRVQASVVICSGAKIGTAQGWTERAELVRRSGTTTMIEGSKQRWFGPGFPEAHPDSARALLDSLARADQASYARVCEALAQVDLRSELPTIGRPVMVMGGRHDAVVDPDSQRAMAQAIPGATLRIVEDAAHLAPAECPAEVAQTLGEWIATLA